MHNSKKYIIFVAQLKTMAENKRKEEFACVVLSRGDFECMGYDTSNISDAQMERIASRIGDTLVENLYWECIREWGNDMPKLNK